MLPHKAALQEAFEEAGVLGVIDCAPVGEYTQRKLTRSGTWIDLLISAYPLWVNTELLSWPEMTERQRCWASLPHAAEMVRNSGLRGILRDFSATVLAPTCSYASGASKALVYQRGVAAL